MFNFLYRNFGVFRPFKIQSDFRKAAAVFRELIHLNPSTSLLGALNISGRDVVIMFKKEIFFFFFVTLPCVILFTLNRKPRNLGLLGRRTLLPYLPGGQVGANNFKTFEKKKRNNNNTAFLTWKETFAEALSF